MTPPRACTTHEMRGALCVRCGMAADLIELCRHHKAIEEIAGNNSWDTLVATITAGLIHGLDPSFRALLLQPDGGDVEARDQARDQIVKTAEALARAIARP